MDKIVLIVIDALYNRNINYNEIDAFAATAGPGLRVSLTVGLNVGKSIAAFLGKPFLGINHLEGHALSPGLEREVSFPYLLFLIYGGHSLFLIVKNEVQISVWRSVLTGCATDFSGGGEANIKKLEASL